MMDPLLISRALTTIVNSKFSELVVLKLFLSKLNLNKMKCFYLEIQLRKLKFIE